ncbi:MAG: tetratricopeptide repeat protein [Oscillospiraceae bacterium]|nr:tetratricopeptide repeat protein [Oscillospiraceae bacterium]
MEQFDAQKFYDELDKYFAGFDNEATEAFLRQELDKADNIGMILGVSSSCPTCNIGKESECLSDEERALVLQRSQARIAVLNEMACFYRGISKWEPCISTFKDLVMEMEFSGLQESEQYALVLINMAGAYRLLGQFDEALDMFGRAGAILENIGCTNDYDLASLYNNTGLVYQDQDNLPKAVEFFEKALAYTRKVEDNEAELATALSNLSLAYYRTGDKENAQKTIEESLSIFEKLDDGLNPHYAGALNTEATYCYLAGDYDKSASYFQQAAEKTKLIFGENKDYVSCCRNCSMALEKKGDAEGAKKYAALADAAQK